MRALLFLLVIGLLVLSGCAPEETPVEPEVTEETPEFLEGIEEDYLDDSIAELEQLEVAQT